MAGTWLQRYSQKITSAEKVVTLFAALYVLEQSIKQKPISRMHTDV